MKVSLVGILFLISSSAIACPNISGTYKVDNLGQMLVRVQQNGCTSAEVEMLDEKGKSYGTKTEIYDGELRDSWLEGEVYAAEWSGDLLRHRYYLTDDGTFVDSKISQTASGDLVESQTEYLHKHKKTATIHWKKQ